MANSTPMRFRFTIRDLLWLTALVAMGVGWWSDHKTQLDRYDQLESSSNIITVKVKMQEYESRIDELQQALKTLQNELSDATRPDTSH